MRINNIVIKKAFKNITIAGLIIFLLFCYLHLQVVIRESPAVNQTLEMGGSLLNT